MSEVIGGLFIGDKNDASNYSFLSKCKITHVLSAAKEIPPQFPEDFEYLHLKLKDRPNFDVRPALIAAARFVNDALKKGGRVLVHCKSGVSRSCTCVIAFLIIYRKFSLKDALQCCVSQRPQCQPNSGFMLVLQQTEHIGLQDQSWQDADLDEQDKHAAFFSTSVATSPTKPAKPFDKVHGKLFLRRTLFFEEDRDGQSRPT